LWVEHRAGEWLLVHRSSGDETDSHLGFEAAPALDPLAEEGQVLRFAMGRGEPLLRLVPVLPDRPLVSRPEHPFHVLAGEEVRIFVSCPVWVAVQVGKKPQTLAEIPIYRSTDTWFGPNTREGALAYASRTRCRLAPGDLPVRPQRAEVPVVVRNRADATLVIERLSLPVPHLALYRAPDGGLWTSQVKMVVQELKGQADIEVGKKPGEVGPGELVTGPRDPVGGSILTRAIGAMIG
jgi:hypothetical protein